MNIVNTVSTYDLSVLPIVEGRWYRVGSSLSDYKFYQDMKNAQSDLSRSPMQVTILATDNLRQFQTINGYYYIASLNVIYLRSDDAWTQVTDTYAGTPAATLYDSDGTRIDITDVIDNNGLLKNGSVVIRDENRVVRAILSVDDEGNIQIKPYLAGGLKLCDNLSGSVMLKNGVVSYDNIMVDAPESVKEKELEAMINALASSISTTIKAINSTNNTVNTLDTRESNHYNELLTSDSAISARVSVLESQSHSEGGSVDPALVKQVAQNTQDIKDLDTRVTKNANDISSQSTSISELESNYSTLNENLNKVSTSLDSTNTEVSDLTTRVDDLEKKPKSRAIKYVEDYRTPNITDDTAVIKAALYDLKDGETLMFNKWDSSNNKPGTYELSDYIDLTARSSSTSATRHGNTFDGCGCVIVNGSNYNTSSSYLFLLSNLSGNGLDDCKISNFIFKYNPISGKSGFWALHTATFTGSNYCNYCEISHCWFGKEKNESSTLTMAQGLYICGEGNEVHHCHFNQATKFAMKDDGGTKSYIHDNVFEDCYGGLEAQQIYQGKISHNMFYRCTSYSLYLPGTDTTVRSDLAIASVDISDNVIQGLSTKSTFMQTGIFVGGCLTDLKITGNFIYNIRYLDPSNTLYTGQLDNLLSPYGCGIYIQGVYQTATNGLANRASMNRIIISNNIIKECERCGIHAGGNGTVSNVLINNNQIYGMGTDSTKKLNVAAVIVKDSWNVKIHDNIIQGYVNRTLPFGTQYGTPTITTIKCQDGVTYIRPSATTTDENNLMYEGSTFTLTSFVPNATKTLAVGRYTNDDMVGTPWDANPNVYLNNGIKYTFLCSYEGSTGINFIKYKPRGSSSVVTYPIIDADGNLYNFLPGYYNARQASHNPFYEFTYKSGSYTFDDVSYTGAFQIV